LVIRSVSKTPTETARAAVRASDWERNRQAWNLPHATDAAVARPEDDVQSIAAEGSAEPEPDRKLATPRPAE